MSGRAVRCAAMVFSLNVLFWWSIGLSLPSAVAEETDDSNERQTRCYVLGLETAEDEYSGRGAFWGGLVAGTVLGPIGYGIGAITLNNWEMETPPSRPESMCRGDRGNFVAGYHDYVIDQRRRRYRNGALIGTLVFVVWASLSIRVLD